MPGSSQKIKTDLWSRGCEFESRQSSIIGGLFFIFAKIVLLLFDKAENKWKRGRRLSVTRFGAISIHYGQSLQYLEPILRGLYSIWQTMIQIWPNFCFWANFIYCKWPHIEQKKLTIWSHWQRLTNLNLKKCSQCTIVLQYWSQTTQSRSWRNLNWDFYLTKCIGLEL